MRGRGGGARRRGRRSRRCARRRRGRRWRRRRTMGKKLLAGTFGWNGESDGRRSNRSARGWSGGASRTCSSSSAAANDGRGDRCTGSIAIVKPERVAPSIEEGMKFSPIIRDVDETASSYYDTGDSPGYSLTGVFASITPPSSPCRRGPWSTTSRPRTRCTAPCRCTGTPPRRERRGRNPRRPLSRCSPLLRR